MNRRELFKGLIGLGIVSPALGDQIKWLHYKPLRATTLPPKTVPVQGVTNCFFRMEDGRVINTQLLSVSAVKQEEIVDVTMLDSTAKSYASGLKTSEVAMEIVPVRDGYPDVGERAECNIKFGDTKLKFDCFIVQGEIHPNIGGVTPSMSLVLRVDDIVETFS